MMKRLIFAVAIAAVAVFMVAGTSSADVTRFQTLHATLTVNLTGFGFGHVYSIDISPCDGTFTGTGALPGTPITEQVTGTYQNGKVSFHSVYNPGAGFDGYEWGVAQPASLGAQALSADNGGGQYFVTMALSDQTSSHFKNHGEYVSSMGGGADAAHACIGMPVGSQAGA
jgi:hypothetical protein